MTLGISGYGVAIPRLRIKRDEYAKAWGSFSAAGVEEKAVAGFDEDMLTLATKVGHRALESVPLAPDKITRFAFASTTAPYTEKLLSGTILAGLGASGETYCTDHTSSTRAGTEALLAGFEHLAGNPAGCALVAAADAPQASMWDPIEHGMGSGAAAFVLSGFAQIAELEGSASYVSEYFGERFRPREEQVTRDLNVKKFSEGSFVTNATKAASVLMKKLGRKPEDYAHVVIQQPDARAPATVAAKLGFQDAQLASGMISTKLGDLGAASTPMGLAAALEVSKPGERVFVVSYGSGAGSDALSFTVVSDRKPAFTVSQESARKEYIDYIQYLKLKGAIR
ncbi:MAG TPA: hydroxymethylglutaryl-CoA synthase [Thermoplasmata archaeon]|nr:hydroxymethylglutaryl-CoA synthase [Thermoplasmata archaeon]